jgi:hypothetical protein
MFNQPTYLGKTLAIVSESQSVGLPWGGGILKLHSKATAMSVCRGNLLFSSAALLLLPEGMLVGATGTEGRK